MRLSYSKLSAYEKCPYSYKKVYIDRVKTPYKKYFSFGHSLHAALEDFYSGRLSYWLGLKKPSKENLISALRRHWKSEGYTSEESERAFDEGGQILENYYEVFVRGDFSPAWRVEPQFSFSAGRHQVGGFIDRIHRNDGGFEIIDYKTHRQIPEKETLERDLQLPIYYIGCTEYFRKKITAVSYIFLRHAKKVTYDVSRFDVGRIKQRIEMTADRMAGESDFRPRRNNYCGACDFKNECGLFNSA